MRFHRRPQKSRSEEARYGRSNCGSISMPSAAPAAAVRGRRRSRKQYMWTPYRARRA
jgi:hypothetical protein